MPTTVVKTIKSGGDYTTLQCWEDAAPANYVSADQIWQGQASGTFSGSGTQLTVSGGTVDSTRYLELTTEAGASFRDNANVQSTALGFSALNGCAITNTGSYSVTISVNQEFSRFSNLQITCTGGSGNANTFASALVGGSSAIDVNNCIIETVRGAAIYLFGSNEQVRNSLCVQRGSARGTIVEIRNGAKAYNCTFACPSNKTAVTNAITGAYTTAVIQNCAFFGCSNSHTGTAPTFTTCYTDDASPPSGCTTLTYNTSLFVNITDATRDYRIPSGSGLIDVGTTDSTNAATDIAGTARPSGSAYDVGCWEYVAAGGGTVFNIFSGRGGAAAQPLVN